jgi:hypothetical protein
MPVPDIMLEAPFAINGIANMLKSCADDYCRDAMIGYQKDMAWILRRFYLAKPLSTAAVAAGAATKAADVAAAALRVAGTEPREARQLSVTAFCFTLWRSVLAKKKIAIPSNQVVVGADGATRAVIG